MVLPIIVGIGLAAGGLLVKTSIGAFRKYKLLTPQMIALLNDINLIQLVKLDLQHPHFEDHKRIIKEFPGRTGFADNMTEQEALLILGIKPTEIPSLHRNDLKKRYRALMIANHPDKNGSVYLAQKINTAKDILDKSYMFNDEK